MQRGVGPRSSCGKDDDLPRFWDKRLGDAQQIVAAHHDDRPLDALDPDVLRAEHLLELFDAAVLAAGVDRGQYDQEAPRRVVEHELTKTRLIRGVDLQRRVGRLEIGRGHGGLAAPRVVLERRHGQVSSGRAPAKKSVSRPLISAGFNPSR